MRKIATAALAASVFAGTLAMATPASAQYWAPPPPPPPHAWGAPPPFGHDGWQRHRYWEWRHEQEWRHREYCRWHDCW